MVRGVSEDDREEMCRVLATALVVNAHCVNCAGKLVVQQWSLLEKQEEARRNGN